jgi:hypothetical protein
VTDADENAEQVPDLMGGRHLADAVSEENRRKERAARLRAAPVYRQ